MVGRKITSLTSDEIEVLVVAAARVRERQMELERNDVRLAQATDRLMREPEITVQSYVTVYENLNLDTLDAGTYLKLKAINDR